MGRFDGGPRDGFDQHEPRRPTDGPLGKNTKPHERQERRVSKGLSRFKAHQQKGSGNQPWAKGDVNVPQPESLLAECKTTDKRHLLIEMAWLRKINREAQQLRKTPALVFGFEGMTPPTPKDWVSIPLDVFERLIQAAGWDMERGSG